ncbi:MAG: DUF4282 domain-containing protein [Oscillospiraceae bacterium]|jgi:hypothetical protein|nr:DUF4282 domain-containing protein [Oscillospiraceae bacterium]
MESSGNTYIEHVQPQSTSESFWQNVLVPDTSTMICLVGSILVGALIFLLFFLKKNKKQPKGIVKWFSAFFNFENVIAEDYLKVLYVICACWLTSSSAVRFAAALSGGELMQQLLILIASVLIGNIILRILFEYLIAVFITHRDVKELKKRINSGAALPPAQAEEAAPAPVQTASALVSVEAPATIEPQPEAAPAAHAGGVVFCRSCGNIFSTAEDFCPKCGNPKS